MQDALALARSLVGPRVVPRSVQRELRELAGVPVAGPFAVPRVAFIHDVEAMAGRAIVGAGAATDTGQRFILPERTREMLLHKLLDLLGAEMAIRARDGRRGLLRRLGLTGEKRAPFHAVWIRAAGPLPDDTALQQCVLAYASDMTLLDAALAPHGRTLFEQEFMAASLDHALWLHRPFRADDWLLYAQDSPNLHGSRGFSRGLIFTRDGTLVASVAQEGLVRLRRT